MNAHLPMAAIVVAVGGCGAKIEGRELPDAAVDALGDDALPDAPPDGRPCAGGDAHATDATGACFVFFKAPRTRAGAEAACLASAAHLAIVRSPEQNAVVLSLASGVDAFLGATDVAVEGSYLWPDGSPLTFMNFRAGEPNNGAGAYEEDCLILEGARNGTWDDRPCAPPPANTGSYAYLCEL